MDWFKDNNKKVGDVITTKIHEVMKTGVKVYIDKDKQLIVSIRKADLANPLRMRDRKFFLQEMR